MKPKEEPKIYTISANDFIEAQTQQIMKEFKCSKPRPRNKAMGFRGSDKERALKRAKQGYF